MVHRGGMQADTNTQAIDASIRRWDTGIHRWDTGICRVDTGIRRMMKEIQSLVFELHEINSTYSSMISLMLGGDCFCRIPLDPKYLNMGKCVS